MFGSIVVGTDGSETAREAVRQAVELAPALGATLQIVSAYEPVAGRAAARGGPAGARRTSQWMVNPREDVDATLRDAAEPRARRGVEAETYARQGDPADAILDVAEEQGADLIVVGNKGMTGAQRFLLGSVPNKVSPPRALQRADHPDDVGRAARVSDRRGRRGRAPPASTQPRAVVAVVAGRRRGRGPWPPGAARRRSGVGSVAEDAAGEHERGRRPRTCGRGHRRAVVVGRDAEARGAARRNVTW